MQGESRPGVPHSTAERFASIAANIARIRNKSALISISGKVADISTTRIIARGIAAFVRLGDLVTIETREGDLVCQVVGISSKDVAVVPFAATPMPRIGDAVRLRGPLAVRPHSSWKGRSLNALGVPIDGLGGVATGGVLAETRSKAPPALQRTPLQSPLRTNVTVIDLFTPMCVGQRIGIFAGSGVGKSTLLAMLARAPQATVVVVCLVGERGREVREFLEDTLGDARRNAVCIVATSDESAMMRRLAPRTAMSVAEHFRAAGDDVLLIVDSLTRFAHAEREFALAAGELPVARGYPPSAFHELAHLVERAGAGTDGEGAITLLAAVLVDGDDHNDPVADAVRGLLDGHIVLDRHIAAEGRMPAVDIGASVSRLADRAVPAQVRDAVRQLRKMIATFEETRDLRLLNGHRAGVDPVLDKAITVVPKVYDLLQQRPQDDNAAQRMKQILALAR